MNHGDIDRKGPRRLLAGAVALLTASLLTACTTAEQADAPATAPAPTTTTSTAAPRHFGPTGYGKLTVTMTEAEALATGDLQTAPVSTVLGRNVYSFTGGPKPDPSRMAADEKLEKQVEAASKDTSSGRSAAEHAKSAELYASSTNRIVERLEAFMTAGGASFTDGRIDSIAAPEDAVTAAGIKRGSTVAELKAAYPGDALKVTSETTYEVAAGDAKGWALQFEVEKDTVKFMALLGRG